MHKAYRESSAMQTLSTENVLSLNLIWRTSSSSKIMSNECVRLYVLAPCWCRCVMQQACRRTKTVTKACATGIQNRNCVCQWCSRTCCQSSMQTSVHTALCKCPGINVTVANAADGVYRNCKVGKAHLGQNWRRQWNCRWFQRCPLHWQQHSPSPAHLVTVDRSGR